MKLSSILTATAVTIVSMAEPTSAQDKNLRALRPDIGYGHASKIGCEVSLKMMGHLGLAGGKWDKFISKMCPGMKWVSHLATKGTCAAAAPVAVNCGTGLTAVDRIHSATCFGPSEEAIWITGMRFMVDLEEDVTFPGRDLEIAILMDDFSASVDVLTAVPVHRSQETAYISGWNTFMLKDPVKITPGQTFCPTITTHRSIKVAHELSASDTGSFLAVVSNQCPELSVFQSNVGTTFCMEALVAHPL